MGSVWFALGLTAFAGLATGIGSAIAFFPNAQIIGFYPLPLDFLPG